MFKLAIQSESIMIDSDWIANLNIYKDAACWAHYSDWYQINIMIHIAWVYVDKPVVYTWFASIISNWVTHQLGHRLRM